ncbi:MAG TPA: hypothetical protein VGF74_04140 [Thermoleophilaceae bacterium]
MFTLAECLVGLIGLVALDDVLVGRPARHTWIASLAFVAALAALMVAAIAIGRLIS